MADLILCDRFTNSVVNLPPRYAPATAPDGLYAVRNGIAVAVTAEELRSLMSVHGYSATAIIAALSRPADGAAS